MRFGGADVFSGGQDGGGRYGADCLVGDHGIGGDGDVVLCGDAAERKA